jgi:hypothetical protein
MRLNSDQSVLNFRGLFCLIFAGLGAAGICQEGGAVVMGYSAKDQFGQKCLLVGGLFSPFTPSAGQIQSSAVSGK